MLLLALLGCVHAPPLCMGVYPPPPSHPHMRPPAPAHPPTRSRSLRSLLPSLLKVKKGPLGETSPILNDVSSVPTWAKVGSSARARSSRCGAPALGAGRLTSAPAAPPPPLPPCIVVSRSLSAAAGSCLVLSTRVREEAGGHLPRWLIPRTALRPHCSGLVCRAALPRGGQHAAAVRHLMMQSICVHSHSHCRCDTLVCLVCPPPPACR